MPKICDNKSVGVIIRNGNQLAMIKRKNYPVAYAFIAGHLDGDSYWDAAIKEAGEEGGIVILSIEKRFEGYFKNSCKRDGGTGHKWEVWEATEWKGDLKPSSDAKEAFWASEERLRKLAERTHSFAKKFGIVVDDEPEIAAAVTSDPEWQQEPGLEPVWVMMLEKMKIL